jgi:DDE superfamily endonuclease
MMLPLVDIPDIVQHYAPFFASVFSPQAFQQFQRYLSGLILSENKTVEGINRLFVLDTRHQSSLNRLLTESPFDIKALHQARLALLQSLPGTQMKPKGVLSVDDTLLNHYGQHFDQIAYLYDSAQKRYVWAHNLVNLHYSDDLTDYPVDFRLWQPADLDAIETGLLAAGVCIRPSKYDLKASTPQKWRQYLLGLWRRHQHKPEVGKLYQSKLILAQQLIREFVAVHPNAKLPVTFDNWYTQPAFCRFLSKTLNMPYVGTLASDNLVILKDGQQRLDAFDAHLQQEHHQAIRQKKPPIFRKLSITYKGEKETYYSYCKTHHIHNFGKHRLVINHRKADLSDAAVYYLSNQLKWQAGGITRIRRHRWPVEVYHEEGKADGLDQYQVRDFQAISRHIALVAVTYSLLRAAQHDETLLHKLQRHVQTQLDGSAGSWRRNTQAQALWTLATFIATGLSQGQTLQDVIEPLMTAFVY